MVSRVKSVFFREGGRGKYNIRILQTLGLVEMTSLSCIFLRRQVIGGVSFSELHYFVYMRMLRGLQLQLEYSSAVSPLTNAYTRKNVVHITQNQSRLFLQTPHQ